MQYRLARGMCLEKTMASNFEGEHAKECDRENQE